MRVFTHLDCDTLARIFKLTPLETREVRTIYSDEGIFEVDTKVRKWCITDVDPEIVHVGDRTFEVDRSTVDLKEVWQIPLPNVTDHKRVTTYRVNSTTNLVVEQSEHFNAYFTHNDFPALLAFLAV